MRQLLQLLGQLPARHPAAAAAAAFALAGLALWKLLERRQFVAALRRAALDPDKAGPALRRRYSASAILARTRLVAREAARSGRSAVAATGIGDLWIERFAARRRKADLERILRWVAPAGLFRCFVEVMERPRLAPLLFRWLQAPDGGLDVHRLALAGRGEPFDGQAARDTFGGHLQDIRQMTGDPEWPSRYFAVRILVHDDDERSTRALWEALRDSHPLVRRTAVEGFAAADRQRLYEELLRMLLDDPACEVRRSAWERIHREFEDLYSLNAEALSDSQATHVLELLRPDSKHDENVALRFLAGDNLEHRLAAARFLERSLALERLAQEVDLGDREGLERSFGLLRKACEVGVDGFLGIVERTSKPATMLVCGRLLAEAGSRALIPNLARKVFSLYRGGREHEELYRAAIGAVARRGSEAALHDLNREMLRRRTDAAALAMILAELPARGEHVFEESLLAFLKDPAFPLPVELSQAIRRVIPRAVLPVLLDLLQSDRQAWPHPVRIRALELLAELGLPYCLQAVLENLPVLPVEQAVAFAGVLARFPRQELLAKVERLLAGPDARVRASLIAVLPSTGDHEALRLVRPCLRDADPDVRVAAVWALAQMGDARSLAQALDLLRDPVERVRAAAARAVAAHGSEESLLRLKEALADPNEVDPVRAAVVEGLAACGSETAVDILIDRLKQERSLQPAIVDALAAQTSQRALARAIEGLKDADPGLRDLIARAFRRMGAAGERALAGLLSEDIPSLQPLVAELLEASGAVEERIRSLAHRDPAVRREAAAFLARLGSSAAYRGMVLAARDPDQEVRVQVIKALERLETASGAAILESLRTERAGGVRTYPAGAVAGRRPMGVWGAPPRRPAARLTGAAFCGPGPAAAPCA